jgi:pyrroline-5-carboxylate reductase
MRIALIGAGSMAGAMARGWARAPTPPQLSLYDLDAARARAVAQQTGGQAADSASRAAAGAELVVLAVKPAALDAAAAALGPVDAPVLSILGGTPLARVAQALPGVAVARAIPNLPVEVGRGVVCWTPGDRLDATVADRVERLLGALGTVLRVGDGQLDLATALMSSTPAYVALMVEALVDAGVAQGATAAHARRLVVETFAGTAAQLAELEPPELRRRVTSPGGITAAGLAALERGGLRATLADAVAASLERMRR